MIKPCLSVKKESRELAAPVRRKRPAGDDGRITAEQFEARCDASSLWQARHPTWLNCPSMADKAGDDAILRACGTGIGKCRLLSITGCGSAKASVAERPIALPP